jgi:carbon storage regulator
MLVLRRKISESIVLVLNGLTVRVQVVHVSGHGVRLGIDAPPAVTIVREELLTGERPCSPRSSQS